MDCKLRYALEREFRKVGWGPALLYDEEKALFCFTDGYFACSHQLLRGARPAAILPVRVWEEGAGAGTRPGAQAAATLAAKLPSFRIRWELVFGSSATANLRVAYYDEVPLMGYLRSWPLWSFQKFASSMIATSGCTSLNVTFACA
jgi:hypothetical protein